MAGLATTFFLYAASALVAPWWAVLVLVLVWVGFLVTGIRWWEPHPRRLVGLAVTSAVVWFVLLVGGARLLGWGD